MNAIWILTDAAMLEAMFNEFRGNGRHSNSAGMRYLFVERLKWAVNAR